MNANTTKRVARRYLRQAAARSKTAAAPEVSPARLVDLANFTIGFDAYLRHLEGQGKDPDTLAGKAATMIKRYAAAIAEGIEKFIVPLGDRGDAGVIKPALRMAQRGGSPIDVGRRQAALFEAVLPWMQPKPVFRDTFKGKAATAARQVAAALSEENPAARLTQAAAIPSCSGLTTPRKWMEAAAKAAGVEVSEMDSLMADAGAVGHMADDIRKLGALLAASSDPEKQAELAAKRASLLATIQETAQSSDNPAAVLSAAVQAIHEQGGHATEQGRKLGLNPQQEGAMVADGKKVIAAGAGSGKTRVLAGEVAYRINELGYSAESICAVSFTRKASQELISRAQDYGAVIDGAGASGFGTTHSLAGLTILNKYGQAQRRPNYIGPKENWKVTTLVALAVKQVSMQGGGANQAPKPKGMFIDSETTIPEAVADAPVPSFEDVEEDELTAEVLEAIGTTWDFFKYGWPSQPKYRDWAQKSLKFLGDMGRNLENGGRASDLSPGQRSYLNNLFEKTKRVGLRVAAEPDSPEGESEGRGRKKKKGLSEMFFFKNPAGEWFNLGMNWKGGGDKEGKEGQQFSAAVVKRQIDIWKGMGASPTEVWWAAGPAEGKVKPFTPEAAAYAAYEFLKGSKGEPDFRNTGDMSDLLGDAVRVLIHNPQARQALQARFKVVLVDEAQDLNQTQHLLFGLLAGQLDHETLKPKADGSMTSSVFSMVGDDKQAIYEFRGAEPDEFIEKSDMTEEGEGGFDTYLLDTNYRSGQSIVDAANNLIKHNSKQIPMTCKANYEAKGDGAIRAETHEGLEEAAMAVAEEVEDSVAAYDSGGKKRYGNFGIAVRSNAEADHYALAMISKAIPFKTKVDPFRHKHMKAMLGWMTLVEQGHNGDPSIIKKAIEGAVLLPTSFMGKAFTALVARQKDPLGWLLNGDYQNEVQPNYLKRVAGFVENLKLALRFSGAPDAASSVYTELLKGLVGGGGQSFFDSIVDDIKSNSNKMAEIAAENPDGIPTDEQITEAAEEQLLILNGLMKARESVSEIMEYTRELQKVNDRTRKDDDSDDDAVIIGTMHSWKGLECPKMFIPMVRGKFPRGKVSKDPTTGKILCEPPDPNDPALASERRLAYVAITRAEADCVILDIPHPKLDCPPSQFISESCIQALARNTDEEPVAKVGSDDFWDDAALAALAALEPEPDLETAWPGFTAGSGQVE